MLRKYVKKVFRPKVFGPGEKKTKAIEEHIKKKYGLEYKNAKRVHEMVHAGKAEEAVELFNDESNLKGLEKMSNEKKLSLVKEISRMEI